MKNEGELICEDCGEENGFTTICPYAADVNNEDIEVVLCEQCEEDRAMEI